MSLQVGATYYINFEGKVKLEAKIFRIYMEEGREMVEWGICSGAILETVEKFMQHIKAA